MIIGYTIIPFGKIGNIIQLNNQRKVNRNLQYILETMLTICTILVENYEKNGTYTAS